MSLVWYVSYGSNMAAQRLSCYIRGGVPTGGSRRNPGARSRVMPECSIPVDLPGTVYFAGDSPQWGGGVAFYDHDTTGPAGTAAGRGYLLTAGQLVDVFRQEMYRLPRDGDPLEQLVLGPLDDGRHSVGDGVYETLVAVGSHDGHPLLTFTSPHGADDVPHTRPSPRYLDTMASGLRESRDWSEQQVRAYLDVLLPA